MSNVISKVLFPLAFALAGMSVTAAAADHATLTQNERAAQSAIVQPSPYASGQTLVHHALVADTTPATLAINEAAASRAIFDPPSSRGSQAVTGSYGDKATLSQNERAARRAIVDDGRERNVSHTSAGLKRVTTR